MPPFLFKVNSATLELHNFCVLWYVLFSWPYIAPSVLLSKLVFQMTFLVKIYEQSHPEKTQSRSRHTFFVLHYTLQAAFLSRILPPVSQQQQLQSFFAETNTTISDLGNFMWDILFLLGKNYEESLELLTLHDGNIKGGLMMSTLYHSQEDITVLTEFVLWRWILTSGWHSRTKRWETCSSVAQSEMDVKTEPPGQRSARYSVHSHGDAIWAIPGPWHHSHSERW